MPNLSDHTVIVTAIDIYKKLVSYTLDGVEYNISLPGSVDSFKSVDIQIMALKSSYYRLLSLEAESKVAERATGEYADIIGQTVDPQLFQP